MSDTMTPPVPSSIDRHGWSFTSEAQADLFDRLVAQLGVELSDLEAQWGSAPGWRVVSSLRRRAEDQGWIAANEGPALPVTSDQRAFALRLLDHAEAGVESLEGRRQRLVVTAIEDLDGCVLASRKPELCSRQAFSDAITFMMDALVGAGLGLPARPERSERPAAPSSAPADGAW